MQTPYITVSDTGAGLTRESILNILKGKEKSSNGTVGEQGYGFDLVLVKHLVDSLKGTMSIQSLLGAGTSFNIILP